MKQVDIDTVKPGVMLYNAAGVPLGAVVLYLEMNGNRAAKQRRHLNDGQPKNRFAYRREALYLEAKQAGPVFIKLRDE